MNRQEAKDAKEDRLNLGGGNLNSTAKNAKNAKSAKGRWKKPLRS